MLNLVDSAPSNETSENESTPHDQLDEQWYVKTYPQVAEDLGEGRAKDVADHFAKIGRFRGYVPNADVARPENPAAPPSRFGGMWTDFGNALDLLHGKHELGRISDAQAELLKTWITDGYVIIKNALEPHILDEAMKDLDLAYSGGVPGLIMECVDRQPRLAEFLPHHRDLPAKALDLHWWSRATRDAIFAPKIVNFIESVFERRPMATQTLGFWRGSAQGSHQDSAYVSYSLNMHFCASWIAYEDVQPGAGELLYYPGSQKLPEYLYHGTYKNIVDAARLSPERDLGHPIADHVQSLPGRANAMGLSERTFLPKAGDALIWSADLAHGGKPISTTRTRKSMVTHYTPKELAPLYFEQDDREVRKHEAKYLYATSVY